MGIVVPDAGWMPPDGIQLGVHDAYDMALASYWTTWIVSNAPGDPLYGRVLAAVLAHSVDLRDRHWEADDRPCARIYACTKAQVVAILREIYPEYRSYGEGEGFETPEKFETAVQSAIRWLYGKRRRLDPLSGRRAMVGTDEGPLELVELGRGSGQGGAGKPSLYILRLPGGMTARGAEPEPMPSPEAEKARRIDPALRGPWVGTPCLDEIIERHRQAAAGRPGSRRVPSFNRDDLAAACMDLLSEGWTWADISRAHEAYIRDWKQSDNTENGKFLKGLGDFLGSTLKDHRTPDTRWGIQVYLHPGRPWPELASVSIRGAWHSWTWELNGREGSLVVAGEDPTVEDAADTMARWLYTTDAGMQLCDEVWELSSWLLGGTEGGERPALPRGIELGRDDAGCWVWGVSAPGWTWRRVSDYVNESRGEAVQRLSKWFRTENGAKALTAARETLKKEWQRQALEEDIEF